MDSNFFKDAGRVMKVQQHQIMSAEEQIGQMDRALSEYKRINDDNIERLDLLIEEAELLCNSKGINGEEISHLEKIEAQEIMSQLSQEVRKECVKIVPTSTVDYTSDWKNYLKAVNEYAKDYSIDLVEDPYATLLSQQQHDSLMNRIKEDYYAHKPQMDKYDYIIAATCGVFAGIVDSVFVGMPKHSVLGDWTNEMTDKAVIKIAKMHGWKPRNGEETIGKAITKLEGIYKVNYDQATGKTAGDLLGMSADNHHFKSLSHAPDMIGMIFSIIDQLNGTSHFLDNGRMIVFDTGTSKLVGKNLVAKIYAGFVNWLGHCISDIAGSGVNRTKNSNLYGSGISIPFFEVFQGIKPINMNEEKLVIADVAVKMFEQGYDARYGMAMSIPVLINELLVRICFVIKRHYFHKEPWKNCVPIVLLREIKNIESNAVILRRMLLASYGSMCLVDFGDAAIRSGGINSVSFLLHLNFQAWKKFAINLAISGVMELRLNYEANHLNIRKLDKDLIEDWNKLYLESTENVKCERKYK